MRARLLYCTHYCSPVVITLTDVYLVAAPLSHRSYNKEQVLHCVMDALHCTALPGRTSSWSGPGSDGSCRSSREYQLSGRPPPPKIARCNST